MPDLLIEGVPSTDIVYIYDRCWPFFSSALQRAPNVQGKHTYASLYASFCAGKSQLWIIWDNRQRACIAAAMTAITTPEEWPGATCLEIPLVGGTRLAEWGGRLLGILSRWGLAHGCTHMVGYGRKGWIRKYGFREFGKTKDGMLIIVKSLKDN